MELAGETPATKLESGEMRRASAELVRANRFFREITLGKEDAAARTLLEDLEPILLEIARSRRSQTITGLAEMRKYMEIEAALLEIRIVVLALRQRQAEILEELRARERAAHREIS